MNFRWGWVWVLMVPASVACAGALEANAIWCEEEWLARSGDYAFSAPPDYRGLQKLWEGYADKCRGTVSYEAYAAIVYFYVDEPAKGRAILKTVAGKPSAYAHLFELAQLLIEARELLLASKPLDVASVAALDQKFAAYVRKYPDFAVGYSLLGDLEGELGRHDAAIELYQRALTRAPDDVRRWGIYRNLTIHYTEAGRYDEAYAAAGQTIGLKET